MIPISVPPYSKLAGAAAEWIADMADVCGHAGVTWSKPDKDGKQEILICGEPAVGAGVFPHYTDKQFSLVCPLCERHRMIAEGLTVDGSH